MHFLEVLMSNSVNNPVRVDPFTQFEVDRWDDIEPKWRPVFEWVESFLGGTVRSYRRQARWRPCWFIDVELADGSTREVYVRCQREEDLPWTRKLTLEREYR